MSLDDAKSKIEAWRRHYNETRPHTALGFVSPSEYAQLAARNNGPLVQRHPKTSPRPWTNIGGPSRSSPVVSSNGPKNGIVWILLSTGLPTVLHAFWGH
jgi:Integrase core domain